MLGKLNGIRQIPKLTGVLQPKMLELNSSAFIHLLNPNKCSSVTK